MSDVDELIEFATNLDWAQYTDDEQIRSALEEARARISELDADDSLSDAQRVKLVVVGDSAVGKTSLLIAFATDKFPDDYVPTVFENYTAQMQLNNEHILLHLWDTAGQEDYDRLRPLSYPGADVVLLCFCLVSEATYEAISEKWAPEVKHYVPDVPTVLIGTKVDLRDQKTADPHAAGYEPISAEKGKELAKAIGAKRYCEISAKTRKGLEEAFHESVSVVLEARGTAPKEAPKKPAAGSSSGSSSKKPSDSGKKTSGSSSSDSGKKSSGSSKDSKDDKRKGGKKKGDDGKKGNCKQN